MMYFTQETVQSTEQYSILSTVITIILRRVVSCPHTLLRAVADGINGLEVVNAVYKQFKNIQIL